MEDRKNEGNKPLTPATDKSGKETTSKQHPKCQKLEPLPIKKNQARKKTSSKIKQIP